MLRWHPAAAWLCVTAAVSAGCGTGGVQIVRVCGDVRIPAEVDLLRIVLRDDAYEERSSGAVDLTGGDRSLPLEAEVRSYPGRGYLSVQALHAGLEVIRFDRLYPTLDRREPVEAALTQACLGVTTCPLGQTCVNGECVIAPDGDTAVSCSGRAPPPSSDGGGP